MEEAEALGDAAALEVLRLFELLDEEAAAAAVFEFELDDDDDEDDEKLNVDLRKSLN